MEKQKPIITQRDSVDEHSNQNQHNTEAEANQPPTETEVNLKRINELKRKTIQSKYLI